MDFDFGIEEQPGRRLHWRLLHADPRTSVSPPAKVTDAAGLKAPAYVPYDGVMLIKAHGGDKMPYDVSRRSRTARPESGSAETEAGARWVLSTSTMITSVLSSSAQKAAEGGARFTVHRPPGIDAAEIYCGFPVCCRRDRSIGAARLVACHAVCVCRHREFLCPSSAEPMSPGLLRLQAADGTVDGAGVLMMESDNFTASQDHGLALRTWRDQALRE